MDLTDTIAPTSDQLDAVDLLSGPRTFTIKAVRGGNAEQPVQIDLDEFPRPWRPGKSMRRVLVAVWGADASVYVGRRLTLFCDPTVKFGGEAVGGTRISHMSPPLLTTRVPLLVTRGKSAVYTVEPLPPEPTPDEVAACTDKAALGEMWKRSGAPMRAVIEARVSKLTKAATKPESAPSPSDATAEPPDDFWQQDGGA